ncbi:MAG: hypothetical protein ABUL60_29685 [Myxococcales bacterium]
MTRPFETWKVLPHGKLTAIEDNLLTVVGELQMPLGEFPRRMSVVRLQDGRLVIYSAIALDEPEMAALEKFGSPAFLIVPSDRHRLDAKIWRQRYPQLVVIAPEGARAKVEEVVRVDATSYDFGDPTVELLAVPGMDQHDAALVVRSPSGVSLVLNELIWNVDNKPGFGGWLMKTLGFTKDEPQIPALISLTGIKDKPALQQQLEAWSQLYGLKRIIVSHGAIIENDPAIVLRDLASQLAA